MTSIRIATWNINSIRSRLEHLERWLELRNFPEIVCLQETKVVDKDFVIKELEKLGYQSAILGQKSYNGVAILSRLPIANIVTSFDFPALNKEARVISAEINGITVINVYVPNGQQPQSEKYIWKFEFLQDLKKYLKEILKTGKKVIVCGDFNIAPADIDVWRAEGYRGSIMFTEAEQKIFRDIMELGFEDVFRVLNPRATEFSWYDYISAAFDRNQGWRIDFILATPELSEKIEACKIDCEPRGWLKPSDHCPVVAKINI